MIGVEAISFSSVSMSLGITGRRSGWQTESFAIGKEVLQRHTSQNSLFHLPSDQSQIFLEMSVLRDDTCAQNLSAFFYKRKLHLSKGHIHAPEMSLFQQSVALIYFMAAKGVKSSKV